LAKETPQLLCVGDTHPAFGYSRSPADGVKLNSIKCNYRTNSNFGGSKNATKLGLEFD